MAMSVLIKSRARALELLGKRESKGVSNNTRLVRYVGEGEDVVALRYHNTDVATWLADGSVVLNSGGYQTSTTKERINWALPDGLILYQERRVWYVTKGGWGSKERCVFKDGMKIVDGPDGPVWEGGADEGEQRLLVKMANKYVSGYVKAMAAGDVPAPSNGDCWYCLMVTEDGQSLGDATSPKDHIMEHMEEGYYVPSLLMQAIKENPGTLSPVANMWVGGMWGYSEKLEWAEDMAQSQVRRCLYKYVAKRLGIAD